MIWVRSEPKGVREIARQVDWKHQKPLTSLFSNLLLPIYWNRENFSNYEFFSALKVMLTRADNTNNTTCAESI